MILVDTSIWIDHLHRNDPELADLLKTAQVLAHPFVIGELACGMLRRRAEILGLLRELPQARVASDDEVLLFIERRQLMGRGIGYIDAHLLASAALSGRARIWSRDRRLTEMAEFLELRHVSPH